MTRSQVSRRLATMSIMFMLAACSSGAAEPSNARPVATVTAAPASPIVTITAPGVADRRRDIGRRQGQGDGRRHLSGMDVRRRGGLDPRRERALPDEVPRHRRARTDPGDQRVGRGSRLCGPVPLAARRYRSRPDGQWPRHGPGGPADARCVDADPGDARWERRPVSPMVSAGRPQIDHLDRL